MSLEHQSVAPEKVPFRLRLATTADIPVLIALGKAVESPQFPPLLEADGWRKELENNFVYLIDHNNTTVGRISYEMPEPDHAEINGLVIDPEFQGQGFAREALAQVLEKLQGVKRVDLTVHPDNVAAVSLYLSLGFVTESRIENYFGDGQPRLMLVLDKK